MFFLNEKSSVLAFFQVIFISLYVYDCEISCFLCVTCDLIAQGGKIVSEQEHFINVFGGQDCVIPITGKRCTYCCRILAVEDDLLSMYADSVKPIGEECYFLYAGGCTRRRDQLALPRPCLLFRCGSGAIPEINYVIVELARLDGEITEAAAARLQNSLGDQREIMAVLQASPELMELMRPR